MPNARASDAPVLCAVVVARNEEAFIGRCVESVLLAGAPFEGFEIVVVDSRSVDRTADVARSHGVRTARIRERLRCTAALGRVVGQRLTRSRYILFVDGDTVINPEWVRRAVSTMDAQPDVAGVGGKLREVYYRGRAVVGEVEDFFRVGSVAEEAFQLGGNAVYRRSALDAAGSFHPGVISYEEAELAERLRRAGHRLVRLPVAVGTHHTGARDDWSECWRRFRGGLNVGYGQVLRLGLAGGGFWPHARALNRYLLCLAVLALGALCAFGSVALRRPEPAGGWLALVVVLLAALVVRARSVRRPLAVVIDWLLAAPAIVWGFARGPLSVAALPVEAMADVVPGEPEALPGSAVGVRR